MNDVAREAGCSAPLIAVGGVAQLLACSRRHVYRLADAGRMPAPVRLGALVRWNSAEIENWIAGGCLPVRIVSAKGGGQHG